MTAIDPKPLTNALPPLSSEEILEIGGKCLLGNVNRLPLAFVRGEGTRLYDAEGREYLDFVQGVAVCAFGHAPAFMAEVLKEQAGKLVQVSNLYYNEPLVRLAKLLTEASGLPRAFFSNSGAEANECAFKMARKHGFDRDGLKRTNIVSAINSFHGRTMGAISLTGQEKLHEGFRPLVPGISFVPYGDLPALDKAVDDTVAGVILEPVQGEGGVAVPPEGYLGDAAKLIRDRGALLILDEVQTGLGRTGEDFAFRHFDVTPDILTLGKALGSGYPIGATLSSEDASKALGPGSHSTTVGGAPLSMAVALELATRILDPAFLEDVRAKGRHLKDGLDLLKSRFPELVSEVRGIGLLLGLALGSPAEGYSVALRDRGILVNATAGNVLRFLPPLTVSVSEIDYLLDALAAVLSLKPRE
ncbi:MAG: acetylornithine/succinylornithine family transaminase [Deltaproteobacteria bacterium]|jgi:predicted acetylornithine/succinylornithine family transaminase|nr:acetylornithine/succinylornithine family transaminase [Deltaproteobacteria bacterium]